MQAARKQAKGYAEAIPDEWPPFLIVADVGFCFDIYADFSGTGKNYVPFPDPSGCPIGLDRARELRVRDLLCSIWTDPHSLDPCKISATVTREIAERLASWKEFRHFQWGNFLCSEHLNSPCHSFRWCWTFQPNIFRLLNLRFMVLLNGGEDHPRLREPTAKSRT